MKNCPLLVSGFQVTVTLYGLDGQSEPHHLSDPNISVFEQGRVDVFLLSTLFPLGELMSLLLFYRWENLSSKKISDLPTVP